MKILLINNHTVHITALSKSLAGHQVELQTYRPGIQFNYEDKDLIILSGGGGEGLEIDDEVEPGRLWYDDEMKLVRTADKPILGICMGFEVMAKAYGAPVTTVSQLILGRNDVQVAKQFKPLLGKTLRQYEAHSWRVEDVPVGFEVLATSNTGIEIFRHKDKKGTRLATQFHPEKGGSLKLSSLINSTVLTA
jgi:GMP synthase-like glutamine amidotransferase